MSKDEYMKNLKPEEQKTLNELFNPEFNDIQDLGVELNPSSPSIQMPTFNATSARKQKNIRGVH